MSWPNGSVVFVNASQVVTCAGPSRARRGIEMGDAGILAEGAVLVRDGRRGLVGQGADGPMSETWLRANPAGQARHPVTSPRGVESS